MTQLRPFHPGTSPCGTACPLEWAVPAFSVPAGSPVPILVPEGTILDGMSYAREGVPFKSSQGYFTVSDLPARGYRLSDGRWFVQIEACGNWTIAEIPNGTSYLPAYEVLLPREVLNPAGHSPSSWAYSALADSRRVGGGGPVIHVDADPNRDANPAIPPVPVPPSIVLMLTAIAIAVFLWRVKCST